MTLDDTAQVLALIASRYPNAKLGEDAAMTVQAWQITLADVPMRPHMEVALRAWFEEQKWAPDASELRVLAIDLGGPTPAMIARADYYKARDSHWTALCAMTFLSDTERRRRQADFVAELDARSDLIAVGFGGSQPPAIERASA